MEESRGELSYSFKALRHIIIVAMKLGKYDTMLENQKILLRTSTRPEVSRNELTEAINDVQDAITKHVSDPKVAREMYQLILGNLKTTNERLYYATQLRLGKIYFDEKNFSQLEAVLKELKDSCVDKTSATGYDKAKGHLLLEVLALEI